MRTLNTWGRPKSITRPTLSRFVAMRLYRLKGPVFRAVSHELVGPEERTVRVTVDVRPDKVEALLRLMEASNAVEPRE